MFAATKPSPVGVADVTLWIRSVTAGEAARVKAVIPLVDGSVLFVAL